MRKLLLPALFLPVFALGTVVADPASDVATLASDVEAVELAFAASLAERDLERFESFLSEEAVFLGGGDTLRGKAAVAEAWAGFFEGAEAPFSWRPETVEILDSGQLALSTGPVFDPAGNRVMTFTSIWRQEEPGVWRIVFDRGNKYCE